MSDFAYSFLLNLPYTASSIQQLLAPLLQDNYTFYRAGLEIDTVPLQLDEAINFLTTTYKKDEIAIPRILAKNSRDQWPLYLWIENQDEYLKLTSGFRYYSWENNWEEAYEYVQKYFSIIDGVRILHFEQTNDDFSSYKNPFTVSGPAIWINVGAFHEFSEHRQFLFDTFAYYADISVQPAKESGHYFLNGNMFKGELVWNSSNLLLIPAKPYRMRKYKNETAIDTVHYLEFLFKILRGVPVNYIKTLHFDL